MTRPRAALVVVGAFGMAVLAACTAPAPAAPPDTTTTTTTTTTTSTIPEALRTLPWGSPPLAARWSVMPAPRASDATPRTTIDVNGSAGTVRTEQLELINRSAQDLVVSVAPSSVVATDGRLSYTTPDKVSDPAYWLRVPDGAAQVVVPPGSSVLVPVTITFPNTARTGEQLTALTVTEAATGEVVHVPVRLRTDGVLGSELTLTEAEVRYTRDGWSPLRPGTASVAYTVENTGNTILRGPFVVQFDTAFDRKVPVELTDDVVLPPGATISGSASVAAWPTLALRPEVAVAVPIVDSRGVQSDLRVADIGEPTTAVPWSQLALAALLLGAMLLLWLVVRGLARRRLRDRKGRSEASQPPTDRTVEVAS